MLEEGWYLMNVPELERALRWMRETESEGESFAGIRLSIDQALEFRNAGNVPDENGRSLRLVLHVDAEPEGLARKRPSSSPTITRPPHGGERDPKPVNVVPLGRGPRSGVGNRARGGMTRM